jgi:predicted dehydrogenase
MEVYGRTGYAKTILRDRIEIWREGERQAQTTSAAAVRPPFDDPLHYFAAVISGKISDENGLSSLKTNVLVSEILDAARRSAQSGTTTRLPLND